jgi:hypothetical protein
MKTLAFGILLTIALTAACQKIARQSASEAETLGPKLLNMLRNERPVLQNPEDANLAKITEIVLATRRAPLLPAMVVRLDAQSKAESLRNQILQAFRSRFAATVSSDAHEFEAALSKACCEALKAHLDGHAIKQDEFLAFLLIEIVAENLQTPPGFNPHEMAQTLDEITRDLRDPTKRDYCHAVATAFCAML